jgi:hypothetical protein
MTNTIRLAELTGAIARAVGVSDEETRDVYHAALLRHAGCTASAHEETRIAGDEIELRSTIAMGDAGSPGDMLPRLVRGLARKQGLKKLVRTATNPAPTDGCSLAPAGPCRSDQFSRLPEPAEKKLVPRAPYCHGEPRAVGMPQAPPPESAAQGTCSGTAELSAVRLPEPAPAPRIRNRR